MFQEVWDHTGSMSHQIDYIYKKRQSIKNSGVESIINEMKNSLEGSIIKLSWQKKKKISVLDERDLQCTWRSERKLKNKHSLRDTIKCDTIICTTNTGMLKVPEEEKGLGKYLKNIKEAQWTLNNVMRLWYHIINQSLNFY